jgi:DNA-binding CsgD family transcriptional regulator
MFEDQQSLKENHVKEPRALLLERDPEMSHTIMEEIEFLSDQPTFYEFSQYLVMHVFKEFNPWGACVAVVNHRDRMQMLGSFGLGDGLIRQYATASCIGISLDQEILINGAWLTDSDSQTQELGHCGLCNALLSSGPSAIGLISSHKTFVGFFQVLFLQPVESPKLISKMEATLRLLRVVAPTRIMQSSSHLELHEQLANKSHKNNSEKFVHNQYSESSVDGFHLSPRQMEILNHMADGKTNAAIARIIGFSESTVRQETIEIYRILGVNDRRSAVSSAQLTGLIPQVLAISG